MAPQPYRPYAPGFDPTAEGQRAWLPPPEAHRPLLGHVVEFVRVLQDAGVAVGPGRAIELCRSFEFIDIGNRADFYAAAAATLVSRREDLAPFERVFAEYWEQHGRPDPESGDPEDREEESAEGPGDRNGDRERRQGSAAAEPDGDADEETDETLSWSEQEALAYQDIGTMSERELDHARHSIAAIVKAMASVRSRRFAPHHGGSELDFRRIFRHGTASGGQLFRLAWRKRRPRKTRLLLLCDVSGSMERYSRFLIQFIYALRRELPRVDVGAFSTNLTMISDLLNVRDVDQSLQHVSERVQNWGSGTDIGESLRQFNEQYARRLVRNGTTLVILSDGWDRGDAEVMRTQIEDLHRRVHRLIWLNPLLGRETYLPLCRGIQTALPYMDHFLPAHNLASLRDLSRTLRQVRH